LISWRAEVRWVAANFIWNSARQHCDDKWS
jgi:hypothetical protein